MAVPLRPQHFVSRQDGTLTPLVAVDELPACISIRNVPRVLDQSDTHGMTSLGTLASRGQVYTVDYIHEGNGLDVVPSGADDVAAAHHTTVYSGWNPESQPHGALQWRTPEPSGREAAKQNPGSRPPGGNGGRNATKKKYCSFWLRHGECDYQQQGCIFKHEMPTDLPTLDKLGLRDIPRWYRDKHGVKSIANGNGTQRPDRAWRDDSQTSAQLDGHSTVSSHHTIPMISEGDIGASGQPQYAPSMSGSSVQQMAHPMQTQVMNGRETTRALPAGTPSLIPQNMGTEYRAPAVQQGWKRPDLLTQDEPSRNTRPNYGMPSLSEGFPQAREHARPLDYLPNDRFPHPPRSSQPSPIDSGWAGKNKENVHSRPSNSGEGPVWPRRENRGNDLSSLSLAPLTSIQQQNANQLTEQSGQPGRRSQRPRRLYQPWMPTEQVDSNLHTPTNNGRNDTENVPYTPPTLTSAPTGTSSEVFGSYLPQLPFPRRHFP